MGQSRILVETTEHLRPRIIALLVAGLLVLIAGVIGWHTGGDFGFSVLKGAFTGGTVTPLTLLITGFASGLFFLPVPAELAYVYGLQQGGDPLLSGIAVIGGFLCGHIVSYFIGLKLSTTVRYFLSPKNLYGLRRKVNKWGAYAILGFAVVPSPGPQLTFGLGIARYNFARLMTFVLLGNCIKYATIAIFISFT